jgi:hypothetical protein
MLPLYILTIFTSAALLFVVQPMVGKLVLPSLGGTPAVWNTCMVFFQAVLLVGYGYAHVSRKLGLRARAITHVALQIAALALLPIAIDTGALADASSDPIGPLLLALTLSVGFPFLVVSASAPLFQDWFGMTTHPDADDPYHLYAASNAGSMLSLLAYPIVIEPNLDVIAQTHWWRGGFALLTLLTIGAAVMAWRNRSDEATEPAEELKDPEISWRLRAYWIFAAFIPSSLLLGATTTLTTDVATVPLFWVVPLALYLLTFILVFAQKKVLRHEWMVRALPVVMTPFVVVLVMELNRPLWLVAGLHLLVFFVMAMVFHGELARTRPSTAGLTEFFFWMSFGGVLGGAFNGLLAPVVFPDHWEYPLVLLVATIAMSVQSTKAGDELRADIIASLLLLAVIVLAGRRAIFDNSELGTAVVMLAAMPVFLRYWRPKYFGPVVAVAVLMGEVAFAYNHEAIFQERSFFSASRVVHVADEDANFLLHGNTNHGAQSLKPGYERWVLPYHPPGSPMEQAYRTASKHHGADATFAVLGLGVGGHACFASEGQFMRFFEIDPVVEKIATNPKYFDFMERCEGTYDVVMGDGRIMLQKEKDAFYDLIVLDAFTSDAIPTHLLTTEALREYLEKLSPDGMIAANITNRYLDLEPMLAAQFDELGLHGRILRHPAPDNEDVAVASSVVVVFARKPEHLHELADSPDWKKLEREEGIGVWTDTFSNIVSVYRWR